MKRGTNNINAILARNRCISLISAFQLFLIEQEVSRRVDVIYNYCLLECALVQYTTLQWPCTNVIYSHPFVCPILSMHVSRDTTNVYDVCMYKGTKTQGGPGAPGAMVGGPTWSTASLQFNSVLMFASLLSVVKTEIRSSGSQAKHSSVISASFEWTKSSIVRYRLSTKGFARMW